MGKYTVAELDQMIFVDGYIPVATVAELDSIRTGTEQTMGVGSCWEGIYTTGSNGAAKKYVQVFDIDFENTGFANPINFINGATYDGNELQIVNYKGRYAIFRSYVQTANYRNIRMINVQIDTLAPDGVSGGIVILISGGEIDNCITTGYINTPSKNSNAYFAVGGITGGNYGSGGLHSNLTISKCVNYCSVIGPSQNAPYSGVSGIIGSCYTSGAETLKIEDCFNYGSVSSHIYSAGIIGGSILKGSIERCANYGTINSEASGGIAGLSYNVIMRDCYNEGKVISQNGRGGGVVYADNSSSFKMYNCLSYGAIVSSSGFGYIGALSGYSAGGVYYDSYYDTTLFPTSAGGTGKTTSELQTPTSNIGIYANWDPLIWDFGTSSEYPKLINTP